MSFLDTIHVSGRSQTSGINTQTQSRSEGPTWRSDARFSARTSRFERDRRPTSIRTEPRSAAARLSHDTVRRNAIERRYGADREVRTTRPSYFSL